ncbi:MAG: DUF5652 family protein [Patescibacteria group bacterium]|nr:DUF5652 family protein [Patescibacteria group bacterium]
MEKLSILNNFWILIPLIVWTLAWKGIALWKSARLGQTGWFIAILVLNTVGILEIIYVFLVARKKSEIDDAVSVEDDLPRRKII